MRKRSLSPSALTLIFVSAAFLTPTYVMAKAPTLTEAVVVAQAEAKQYCAWHSEQWMPVARLAPDDSEWRLKEEFIAYARELRRKSKRKGKKRRRLKKVIKRRLRILRKSQPFCEALTIPVFDQPEPPAPEETPEPTPEATPAPVAPEVPLIEAQLLEEGSATVTIPYSGSSAPATRCEVETTSEAPETVACSCTNGMCGFDVSGEQDFIGVLSFRVRVGTSELWSEWAAVTVEVEPSLDNPRRISTLSFWLNAEEGVLDGIGDTPRDDGDIAEWHALTESDDTLTFTAGTRASWAKMPRYRTASSPTGGPAVEFTGYWSGGAFFDGPGPLEMKRAELYMVWKARNANTSSAIFDGGGGGLALSFWTNTSVASRFTGWPPIELNNHDHTAGWAIVRVSYGDTHQIEFPEEFLEYETDSNPIPEGTEANPLRIGCRKSQPSGNNWNDFPQAINGFMTDFIWFSEPLDEKNKEFVVDYLKAKHGLE